MRCHGTGANAKSLSRRVVYRPRCTLFGVVGWSRGNANVEFEPRSFACAGTPQGGTKERVRCALFATEPHSIANDSLFVCIKPKLWQCARGKFRWGELAMSQRDAQLVLLCLAGTLPALAAGIFVHIPETVLASLAAASVVAVLAYRWTVYLIPLLAPRHQKAGLVGKDINKKGTERGDVPVPESLGLAPGVVCLASLALIQMVHTLRLVPRACARLGIGSDTSIEVDPWMDDFPAALASIAFMLMLGFVDDVLELAWRVKLVMPIVASLPLIAAYSGGTAIGLPKVLVQSLSLSQSYVELGALYYVCMVLLVIFCTNSINILAGVNGLEAGQTFIVAMAILTHNVLQLGRAPGAACPPACGGPACVSQHRRGILPACVCLLLHP